MGKTKSVHIFFIYIANDFDHKDALQGCDVCTTVHYCSYLFTAIWF
jgi:hypothetical protein